MKTIKEIQNDMEIFLDWEDKYDYIIDLGKELIAPQEIRNDNNVVDGCLSTVWLNKTRNKNGTYSIELDADAIIVRGLLYVIKSMFDNKTRQDIVKLSAQDLLKEMALDSHLSSQRLNGLDAVIKKIQDFEYEEKLEQSTNI